MEEQEVRRLPFSLAIISVFYGFMAFMSILGSSEQYILFGYILPPLYSKIVIACETATLIYLSLGIYKKQIIARKILIAYNIFAIADILFSLLLVNKEKLIAILKDASALEDYATINLVFCTLLFIILRYVQMRRDYFDNDNKYLL